MDRINFDTLGKKMTSIVDARDRKKTIANYWRRVFAEKNDSAIEKKRREKETKKRERKVIVIHRCPHVTLQEYVRLITWHIEELQ